MSGRRSNRRFVSIRQTHGHVLAADPFGDAIIARAALNFIVAVARSTAYLCELEQSPRRAFEAMRSRGVVIPPAFDDLPGVDVRGQALILRRRKGDGRIVFDYHRRTRRLAGETADSRQTFVNAVKTHPRAAELTPATAETVRSARKAFANALKAAHRRDKAASNG